MQGLLELATLTQNSKIEPISSKLLTQRSKPSPRRRRMKKIPTRMAKILLQNKMRLKM